MSRKTSQDRWSVLLVVVAAGVVGTIVAAQTTAADESQQDGRIVSISPDDGAATLDEAEVEVEGAAPEQPAYWIGIQGAPIDSQVLRTHLQLADDVGVVVRDVVKDSPADKAGLRQHDILIDVNGEQITDMSVLQQAVIASAGKPIEIKMIRLAKEMTLTVTPEKAPADLAERSASGEFNFDFGDMPMGQMNELFKQLQQGGLPGGVRVFGPGMIVGGQPMDWSQMPGGVSVKITRDGDGPATVTVQKGDQTWTVQSDDEKAINELPEEIRPFVHQMLHQGQPGQGIFQHFPGGELRGMLPDQLGRFDFDAEQAGRAARRQAGAAGRQAEKASERLLKRMEDLERQLEELQRRLDGNSSEDGTNPPADPSNT